MKKLLGIVLALTCVSAYQNLDEFINQINSKQNLWKAGRNFHDTPFSELRGLLGSKKLPKRLLEAVPVQKHEINEADIPESFDARTKWPECKSIGEIRDQSACGSCWAVSVSSVIADRICIFSNASSTPEISAKHLMSCDQGAGGCHGGFPLWAFNYWIENGVVSGGPYGSKVGCQPYPFAPCEHHVEGSKPACPKRLYDTPECHAKCDDPSLDFNKELYIGRSAYKIKTEAQIQYEILKNGPVTADFDVYEDFYLYKSGVYVRTSDNIEGGHAVRIIGWGVEKGTKYWLITNSWNEDWGDKGLFKIRRGVDECGIESEVFSGIPN